MSNASNPQTSLQPQILSCLRVPMVWDFSATSAGLLPKTDETAIGANISFPRRDAATQVTDQARF